MIQIIALGTAIIAAISTTVKATPFVTSCRNNSLYPDVADISHASSQVVDFFRGYFTAKSSDNASAWLTFFNPYQVGYYDSTLGLSIPNRTAWEADVNAITQSWAKNAPTDRSYPLRIVGDTTTGAVVYLIDTPGLFGAEIRSLSSVDFLDGTVRRQLDNWDGRGNVAVAQAVPDSQYPHDFGLADIPEQAATEMKTIAGQLNNALSTSNATAAAALFDYNAVFEDLTLRVRIEGQIAIQAYLVRTVNDLPYGQGANLTHILGNAQGGGYEWRPGSGPVRYGISALELDCTGSITRFTAVWDGSRLNYTAIQALSALSPNP